MSDLSVKSKSTLFDFLDQKNNLYFFEMKIRTARSKFKVATNFIWRVGYGVHHRDSILPLPPYMTDRATELIARDSLVCDMASRAYSPQLCVRYQTRPWSECHITAARTFTSMLGLPCVKQVANIILNIFRANPLCGGSPRLDRSCGSLQSLAYNLTVRLTTNHSPFPFPFKLCI